MSGPPTDAEIRRRVREQFSASARRYVESPGHASGDDLKEVVRMARVRPGQLALDVATAGGHTALALAEAGARVVATDLTPAMLAEAEAHARRRGLGRVRFQLADAEALPFTDRCFDVVTVRIAPHHFPHPDRFVREAARVLRLGGVLVVDDNMSPEDAELAEFHNRFEAWRDRSHVWAHPISRWVGWMAEAGLEVEEVVGPSRKAYEFGSWTARVGMAVEEKDRLEAWMLAAPARCREYFAVTTDGEGHLESVEGTFGIVAARKRASG